MSTALAPLIASARNLAALHLATSINACLDEARDPLLNQLERIWQTDPARYLCDDPLILAALTLMPGRALATLQTRAGEMGLEVAARRLQACRAGGGR